MAIDYIRETDSRFQINGVSMPKPHAFKTNRKTPNKANGTERDINTGNLILNPLCKIYETKWRYKLLRDTEYIKLYNAVMSSSNSEYKKGFKIKTINSNNWKLCSYTTYEQDDFDSPEVAFVRNGHRYYQDVEFSFTSMKNDYTEE